MIVWLLWIVFFVLVVAGLSDFLRWYGYNFRGAFLPAPQMKGVVAFLDAVSWFVVAAGLFFGLLL